MALNRVLLLSLLLMPLLAQEIVFKQSCVEYKSVEYAVLRTLGKSQRVFLVNTGNLETMIRPIKEFSRFKQCQQKSLYKDLKNAVLNEPKSITNRGLKNGVKDAYALTVDMCPSSKKGFELDSFKTLLKSKKSFPVTISMTKKWAVNHPAEFQQLKAWDDLNKLKITWMNHGATHPYRRNVPIENNFINLEGVDFKKEVLENEKFLIQEGRIPSVFYRFAGLVSNEKDLKCLVEELGLIPIGSLAWLASQKRLSVIGMPDMFVAETMREHISFIFLKNLR
ncbi:hypothetical protein ACFLR3_03235 [Campylobacterota bacterium]